MRVTEGAGVYAAATEFGRAATVLIDLDPLQPAGRRLLHKNVATDVGVFGRHVHPVVMQGAGDVQRAVDTADGQGLLRVANQTDGLTGNAKADGDLGAQRHKVEMFTQGLAAQARLFMAAVKANFSSQQAGADGDFRFVMS